MSVQIDVVYTGALHCQAMHLPSGRTLTTDAPRDNGGQGVDFSPTDLVAAAIGTCLVTIMGLAAQREGLDITGTRATVVKEMACRPVRRIGSLKAIITVPAAKARMLTATQRVKLENAARNCPVHKSMHPGVDTTITFVYEA